MVKLNKVLMNSYYIIKLKILFKCSWALQNMLYNMLIAKISSYNFLRTDVFLTALNILYKYEVIWI